MDPQTYKDQGVPMAQPPQSAMPPAQPPVGGMSVPASEPPLPAMPAAAPGPASGPMVPAAPQPSAADVSGPAEAADTDLIEKEWIDRAKQIIAGTRDDPYKQVQQLNQLKADYMQKRYNKTVKLPEA